MLDNQDTEQPAGVARKSFFRSVSWTDRSPRKPNPTRPQFNNKARSLLPPLQPLSVTRRNVEEWPKAGSDDLGVWPQPPSTPGGRSAPSIKLSSSSGSTPMEFEFEKDKLAFFEKECSRITDHVYLGSDLVAKNREVLRKNGITHVLNCVGFVCPEYFKGDIAYKTLWLHDRPTEDITSILYDVFDYIEDVRVQGGRVFVHCCQGVSRSTALVIAYLMWKEGWSFEDAFQHVKATRGVANPNMGFACQLLQCQKRVHAVPASPNSVLRMYRMAPHSSYDSLHLVPKMLPDPDVKGLDSRGSFIIHVPLAIYVWIGKHCNPAMADSARAAALQVIKYERAQGPLLAVQEGEEPAGFWAAFCGGESLKRNDQFLKSVQVGGANRKVEEYDQDFEIFLKAVTGGVVPPCPMSIAASGSEAETHLPARENGWCRLRRKFACGIMKDFLLSSKLIACSDASSNRSEKSPEPSPSIKKEAEQSSHLGNSKSSTSTPCDSPDSFSCYPESSPKFSYKSPSLSPSTSDYSSSFTFSPSSSNWSDSSNQSRQPSPSGLSDQLLANRLSLAANDCLPSWKAQLESSEAMFSYNKLSKLSPCIAERRGSNPPSLMLTSVGGPPRPSRTLLRSCSFSLPDLGDDVIIEKGLDSDEIMLDVNTPSLDNQVVSGTEDALNKPVLYLWPTVKKLESSCLAALEAKSIYFMFAPAKCIERSSHNVLYIWLGHDSPRDQQVCHAIGSAQWDTIGRSFLKEMSLPPSTTVQHYAELVATVVLPSYG
ncbi:hypothetical protein V2J09_019924 [Rumex salicifolius]